MKTPTQLRLAAVALMMMALTCAAQGTREKGFSHLQSGIAGQVTISPLCPAVGPGTCPTNVGPYQTTITVLSGHGRVLDELETDAQGFFRLNLPPGTYILVPEVPQTDPPGGITWPWAEPVLVEVKAREVTNVGIRYDSGIR